MAKGLTLVIFTRYPQLGQTKTRMIPELGAAGALALHQDLTVHTLKTARTLQAQLDCHVEIHFHGGNHRAMATWLGEEGHQVYRRQIDGDLGIKMNHAFGTTLRDRGDRTIIIGTDCPSLTVEILISGFTALEHHDGVLGPAWDGGYYLIGLQQPQPELFCGIAWGTEQVKQQTLAIVTQLNLNFALLEPLPDIDRPTDLPIWEQIKTTLEDV
ncbi:MAG: glycosyltransferase [Synechococcaceae cyanobacterium RL_1_2]|nr:glycosyltransferase [Synechococcaceae cyanobacterium RL_1_2]